MKRLSSVAAAALLVLLAGRALGADGPFDRSQFYAPGTATSDDPRRVPVDPKRRAVSGTLVIRNGRLLDSTGSPPRRASVVVTSGRIEKILAPESSDWPKDAQLIDASGHTVMPGLIDLHTHLTYVFQFGQPPEFSSESQADAALRGAERLRYFVESGITSVRDVASHGAAPFLLKKWVAEGRIPGPRVFAAGQLIVGEGGHGAQGGWRTAPGYPDSMVVEASGPDEWRAAVRHQFKMGADLIKLASHYTQEEISAAVDEAHRLGLRVTVDSETIFTEMAAKAGVDCIEHPLPRSKAAVQLMASHGAAAVPTLVPYQLIIESGGGYFGSPSRRFTLNETTMFDMFRELKAAGVKLGVGTDLILDWYRRLPGPYIRELQNFERVGYSPAQALVAATKTNAEILGMADRLGTVEPGKLADLILVDGEPDRNLDDLSRVTTVIVNGRVVVRDGRIFVPRHEVGK